MHIVVCVKDIPNPEAPAALYSIDSKAMRLVPVTGLSNVTSPFDEQALELALREKDRRSEVRVTAISLGAKSSLQAVKRALAMGADDGLHIHDPDARADTSMVAAHVLAVAIRELGRPDLVITGRQAADWDVGMVGCGMAELLGWPVICVASRMAVDGRVVEVDRIIEDGRETVRTPTPCVITAANDVGLPRTDRVIAAMPALPRRVRLYSRTTSVDCQYLPGDVRAAAQELFTLLRAEGFGRREGHA